MVEAQVQRRCGASHASDADASAAFDAAPDYGDSSYDPGYGWLERLRTTAIARSGQRTGATLRAGSWRDMAGTSLRPGVQLGWQQSQSDRRYTAPASAGHGARELKPGWMISGSADQPLTFEDKNFGFTKEGRRKRLLGMGRALQKIWMVELSMV